MTIHHYLFEIAVSDKKYLFELRDQLLRIGCSEKYSGELSVFYSNLFNCNNAIVHVGFSKIIYIDILTSSDVIDNYLNILTSIFPKNRIMLHYVIREV